MSIIHWKSCFRQQAGFLYVEVIVAVVLLAVLLVPALNAVQSGSQATDIHETSTIDHYALQSKMEELLVLPFDTLKSAADIAGNYTVPSSYTDTYTTTDGRDITRQVFLSNYDGDNADADDKPFTGTDDGLLWIQVTKGDSVYRYETLLKQ